MPAVGPLARAEKMTTTMVGFLAPRSISLTSVMSLERKCTPQTTLVDEVTTDLKELGVTQADLVLLHEPCDTDADTIAAYAQMQQLVLPASTAEKPKARAIGISNFNITLLQLLLDSNTTTVVPAVNQCRFSIGSHSMAEKGRSTATLKFCQQHGITYEAYSPLGGLDGIDVLKDPDVQGEWANSPPIAARNTLTE